MNNIILTGIPRSGTSFICSLLNKINNVLALIEPIDMRAFVECSTTIQRLEFLNAYFKSTRVGVIKEKKVRCLELPSETNTFSSAGNLARQTTIKGFKEVLISKDYSPDFFLIIKHPNAFSALLSELKSNFTCYASVRNPVSVIASWSSLDHPLSVGRAPVAELFDTSLKERLDTIHDSLSRQVVLINWYFEMYAKNLPLSKIIRYEDVILSKGACLSTIVPDVGLLSEPIQSMNRNKIYNSDLMKKIAEQLLLTGGLWKQFYSEENILNPT